MGQKRVTIRRSLLRSLVLLTLLTSGAILVVVILAGRGVVEDLSSRIIDTASKQTAQELDHFFASVRQQVHTGCRWAEAGLLDADKPLELNKLFVPVLEEHPQISSMMVSESEGTGYLLLRQALDGDEWMNRVVRVRPEGTTAYKRFWNVRTGEAREETVPMDYDFRTRVWYRGGLATRQDDPLGDVHWTRPVIFFITKDPGITASSHVTDPQGRSTVVAFDLLLLDISRLTTRRVTPSENGTAFVLVEEKGSGDLRVVGLPRDGRYDSDRAIKDELIVVPQAQADADAELPSAVDFPVGPVGSVVRAWGEAGKPASGSVLRLAHADETWWATMTPYDLGQNRFWIAVAVPERDFLGEVARQRTLVMLIALVALLGAIAMAFLLARNYSRPLEKLARASRRIRDLDLDAHQRVKSGLVEVDELAASQRELHSALQSFVRYVPLEVVRELIRRGDVAQIGGVTQTLTVLFTDIEGFTAISERMEPQELAEHMADYFGVLLDALRKCNATVDKLVGDAVVAFWGAPRADEDHARHAVEAIIACRKALAENRPGWAARGLPDMTTRFGLATGEVVVGNIGASSRLNYTVLGDRVNFASRLEGLNKTYGTRALVSEAVRASVGVGFAWRHVARVAVKGKSEPEDIYELIGPADEVDTATQRFIDTYERALEAFHARAFARVVDLAIELRALRSDDRSVELLVGLAAQFMETPPPDDWDGTIVHTLK